MRSHIKGIGSGIIKQKYQIKVGNQLKGVGIKDHPESFTIDHNNISSENIA